ncbi:unnamed protein product [Mytilus coruscus]|uniref:Chitin-binding type-2 domain-containing protein n=1 Tax=Mytilus coruscus TaxID=42192 RepID=A0A6J8C9G6_MYTCO|nr:unnamed protein product [Mytilus coruscus]
MFNGGKCVTDTCLCNDGYAGSKCEIAVSYNCVSACKYCTYFTPYCEGFTDGTYRHIYVWPPVEDYFKCRDERNIYRGSNPCPTNMAPHNGKCKDLFEIPASFWEVPYGVDCTGRPNGNYKSERKGHCDIFYTGVNGNSTLAHCSPGKVFDSKSSFCQNPPEACRPCGSVFKDC